MADPFGSMKTKNNPMLSTLRALQNESDRGCVIVAAALLEDRLEVAIRKKLIPNEESDDELLGSSKPIGSLSAKIDLAYRLGLFGNGDRRAFHIMRKMRNEFAHDPMASDFQTSSHKNRTIQLVEGYDEILDAWWIKTLEYDNVKEALLEIDIDDQMKGWEKIRDLCGERQLFAYIAATMIWLIENITENLEPLKYFLNDDTI